MPLPQARLSSGPCPGGPGPWGDTCVLRRQPAEASPQHRQPRGGPRNRGRGARQAGPGCPDPQTPERTVTVISGHAVLEGFARRQHFILFQRERGREGWKHQCRESPMGCLLQAPPGDPAHDPGLCPDRASTPDLLALRSSSPWGRTVWLTQPRLRRRLTFVLHYVPRDSARITRLHITVTSNTNGLDTFTPNPARVSPWTGGGWRADRPCGGRGGSAPGAPPAPVPPLLRPRRQEER